MERPRAVCPKCGHKMQMNHVDVCAGIRERDYLRRNKPGFTTPMPRSTRLLATTAVLALVICWTGTAHAIKLSDSRLTFGSTFNGPKQLKIESTKPYTLVYENVDGWCWHPGLTFSKLGGVGPETIVVNVPPATARRNEVDHTYLRACDADGCTPLDIRVSCSGQSGCGQPEGTPSGSRPSCVLVPPTQPTAIATVAPPLPTQTDWQQPQRTGTPAPWRTAAPTVNVPTAVATVAPPSSAGFRAPTIAYSDVSISKLVPTSFLKWCPVDGTYVSADQVCADAIENTRNVATMAAIRMWDHYPARKQRDINAALGLSQGFTHLIAQLWTTYRGNFGGYKNTWRTDKDGRQYSVARLIAEDIRSAILSEPAFAKFCAAWPESTLPNPTDPLMGARVPSPLLDFLDLHIDGDRCVAGGTFTRWAVNESTYDTGALKHGILDYEAVLPALTAEQKACVMETHHAHMAVSAFTCGTGPQPPAGIVGTTHRRCSALARTTQELRLLTMLPFNGTFDDRWTPAERCVIAKAQDRAHDRWAAGLLKLDGRTPALWPAIELANQDHAALHLVANLKNPAFGISRPGCVPPIRETTCAILYEPALLPMLGAQP